jgi:uncharacterized protein (TIGR02118 family)
VTTELVALWTTPDDAEGFEADYLSTHIPLVDSVPGLKNAIVSKALDGPYYRMAELMFDDAGALGAAMASDEETALLADSGRLQETYGTKLDVLIMDEQ